MFPINYLNANIYWVHFDNNLPSLMPQRRKVKSLHKENASENYDLKPSVHWWIAVSIITFIPYIEWDCWCWSKVCLKRSKLSALRVIGEEKINWKAGSRNLLCVSIQCLSFSDAIFLKKVTGVLCFEQQFWVIGQIGFLKQSYLILIVV